MSDVAETGSLSWAQVDLMPTTYVTPLDPDQPGPDVAPDIAQFKDLPEPMLAALTALTVRMDEDTCSMPDCNHGIGWVLHEDDDNPWLSGLRWATVVLVQVTSLQFHGSGEAKARSSVALVCEDCHPESVYWQPALDSAGRLPA